MMGISYKVVQLVYNIFQVLDLEEKIKEISKKIERQELTYNRLEDKSNNVMIQFELGTGQEIEEKLIMMQNLWRDITGATAEHKLDSRHSW